MLQSNTWNTTGILRLLLTFLPLLAPQQNTIQPLHTIREISPLNKHEVIIILFLKEPSNGFLFPLEKKIKLLIMAFSDFKLGLTLIYMSKLMFFHLLYPATHHSIQFFICVPLTHQMSFELKIFWLIVSSTWNIPSLEHTWLDPYHHISIKSNEVCLYAKHTLSRMIYMEIFKGSANISWTQILILLFTCVKAYAN